MLCKIKTLPQRHVIIEQERTLDQLNLIPSFSGEALAIQKLRNLPNPSPLKSTNSEFFPLHHASYFTLPSSKTMFPLNFTSLS